MMSTLNTMRNIIYDDFDRHDCKNDNNNANGNHDDDARIIKAPDVTHNKINVILRKNTIISNAFSCLHS